MLKWIWFLSFLTHFLNIPLHHFHLVELPRNLLFNVLEQEVALHVLEPLLLAHSLLLAHQEKEVANVRAVREELVDEHPPKVASASGDENILAWKKINKWALEDCWGPRKYS